MHEEKKEFEERPIYVPTEDDIVHNNQPLAKPGKEQLWLRKVC